MREIHLNLEQFDVDIAYSLTVPGPENGTYSNREAVSIKLTVFAY